MSSKQQVATEKRLPPNAGKGRPKGSINKVNAEVKAMILEALEGVGGVDYLMERAQDPRTASAFMAMVGKVLPLQVTGANGGPVETVARIELVALK
jgi:hypothetical protein